MDGGGIERRVTRDPRHGPRDVPLRPRVDPRRPSLRLIDPHGLQLPCPGVDSGVESRTVASTPDGPVGTMTRDRGSVGDVPIGATGTVGEAVSGQIAETSTPSGLARVLPILAWAPRYQRSWLRPDLIAGVTV